MNNGALLRIANLAQALSIDALPLDNRSDEWWDEFWWYMGMQEAERIKLKLSLLGE